MNANTLKGLFVGLLAALALGVMSAQANADFVATAPTAAKAALPPSTAAAGEACQEVDAAAKDGEGLSLERREMELAMLFLLIGDVPAVNLALTQTSLGNPTDPTPSLPGGPISSGGPGGEPGTPSTTPEPAAWILGVLGSTLAGAASRLRQRFLKGSSRK